MNPLTELFLSRRNYDEAFLRHVDNHHHRLLKDVDVLADRLWAIHEDGSQIVVLPDFDMDGIMSGVIGYAGLAELGFNVGLYLPDPSSGYGFDVSDVDRLIAMYPDVKAILTCDVGITAFEGVDYAKSLGLSVFVTDHHQGGNLPNADVVVNPTRQDDDYELKGICGAHVLHQCLEYYACRYGSYLDKEQISRLRVFAGVGTVSDSMPMMFENRSLVRDALSICRYIYADGTDTVVNRLPGSDVYRRAFRGLYELLVYFSELGKISDMRHLDEDFFGFYLAPMFNSIKRMDGDMELAFHVFFGGNPVDSIERLFALNEKRKEAVLKALDEIQAGSQPYAPFVYLSDAKSGLLGLLATRLMEESGVPTLVLNKQSDGSFSGSGRTPVWYPFLSRTAGQSLFCAGHENAFGVGFDSYSDLMAFLGFMPDDMDKALVAYQEQMADGTILSDGPDLIISTLGDGDSLVDIPDFSGFLRDMRFLRPFGPGFPAPKLLLRFRVNHGDWSLLGSDKKHVKVRLSQGFEVLGFHQATFYNDLDESSYDIVECAGNFSINVYNDVRTIQFLGEFRRVGVNG